MSKVILYDSNNKLFLLLDKPYNGPSTVILEIRACQSEQLQFIADIEDFIQFLNKPDNGIIPSYMLHLLVSPRWST